MVILQAFFLWLIVSTLIIGGAMIFHRFFPEESPWFGFIVPPLAVVVLLNFIEHLVALPGLLYLLPLFLGVTVWLVLSARWFKQPLILPSLVFLASFAFTFGVRCLQPDISYSSDGISDLNMINNFSQGQTLPPPDTWMPPFRFVWYYDLQHYAASVVERLLAVKIGVAYNLSHGLLSALICVVGAGAAYRLSEGRIWITLAVPFLIESAATGTSAYLYLTGHSDQLWLPSDLSTGMALPHPDTNTVWQNPLWNFLLWDPRPDILHLAKPVTLRLQVPGFWTWRDEYHANASGHLLTLLSILVVAELAHVRRTIWPWVLAGLTPLLAVMASGWALPITALLCWVTVPVALWHGRRPGPVRVVVAALAAGLVVFWPAFYQVTSSPQVPPITWIDPRDRVPLLEFLVQWWPILVLWICGWFCFRNLSFATRWVLIVVPLMLLGIELVTIDSRYNTIEKMWGYTWAAGLIGLFPVVASRAGFGFRIVTIVLLFSALVSLSVFTRSAWQRLGDHAAFDLEGTHYITGDENDPNDRQKARMLQVLTPIRHATFLSGKTAFCYNEAPTLAVFTGNKSYIAWPWFETLTNYGSEADYRQKHNDAFYAGTLPDPLRFLQSNKINGVLIWPDDDLSDAFLTNLRQQLDPAYDYIDCKGTGSRNAGVFLLRPHD